MKKHHRKSKRNNPQQGEQKPEEPMNGRVVFITTAGLAVFLMCVYMATLLPGVNSGDSAELQSDPKNKFYRLQTVDFKILRTLR